MNDPMRPSICPNLMASLIDAAPSRVRRRLDKTPTIAGSWTWSIDSDRTLITAGEETVRFQHDDASNVLAKITQVSCSCLLSPKCFHILACVSVLGIAAGSGQPTGDSEVASDVAETGATSSSRVEVSDVMRDTALQSMDAINAVLRAGARRCGVVLQSAMLRAGHQCRATGLINLSAALLSVVEGIVRLRSQSDNTDAEQLLADLARAVMIAREIVAHSSVDTATIGQARRSFCSVSVSRLQGVLAEPIVTRSGFAGTCVYLLADNEMIYQVSDVRPGDPDLSLQVYHGGLDLGSTTIAAARLCRSTIDVQNMTASSDYRLGRGSKTRWAIRNQKPDRRTNAFSAWQKRFGRPLAEQVESIFNRDASDPQTDRFSDDFVGFDAEVCGRKDDSVLVQVESVVRPIALRIAIDTDQVAYRENLALLSRSPGLKFFLMGRLRRHEAGSIDALAIHVDQPISIEHDQPGLELPESWQQCCQLGLDRLERHFLTHTDSETESDVHQPKDTRPSQAASSIDWVAGLRRQQFGLVLGGRSSVPSPASLTHRRLLQSLRRQMLTTAASLVDAVATTAAEDDSGPSLTKTSDEGSTTGMTLGDLMAATELYQSTFRADYHRQAWKDWLSAATSDG